LAGEGNVTADIVSLPLVIILVNSSAILPV